METASKPINEQKEIKMLYLDDSTVAIDSMNMEVEKFNKEEEYISITVRSTSNIEEAIKLFKSENFDVFVCDHNMPIKKGLDLIIYLRKEYDHKNVLYVLHTGGSNLTGELISKCTDNNILYNIKTELGRTLIERILYEIDKETNDPVDSNAKRNNNFDTFINNTSAIYDYICIDIIKDLQGIEHLDPTYRLAIGDELFTPSYIVQAIINRTDFGREYIFYYLEGLKFYNKNRV